MLYLVEPLDELAIQAISSFNDKALVDAGKGDHDFGDPDTEASLKNKEEAYKELEEVAT